MASPHMQVGDLKAQGAVLGPFAEQLLAELRKALHFEGFRVEPSGIEIGGTALNQTVSLDFRVSRTDSNDTSAEPRANVRKFTVPGGHVFTPLDGPVFTFGFSPRLSVENNLGNFRDFVREHYTIAATPPAARHGGAAARIRPLSRSAGKAT